MKEGQIKGKTTQGIFGLKEDSTQRDVEGVKDNIPF